ncbi:DUF4062 domain-containing protein [Aeromonas rivipollensis]|uniref:DUF4062 domain-containing protein n=1 Tax=Aeromonas rivipollensis TaxID=948519 RepID=UPI0030CEBE0C
MKRKLQVFISSTYHDLQEERQAAVSSILKAGHIPAGMELFTAGDRSQMVTIKEWIDESDVYMLILGGRYGSIERTSGISYTELEYDYAQEQGKPAFAVVITEQALETKIRAKGSSFGEKENPKELALFREKVLGNISSFFDDYKDIKLCVHESLADFASNRELKGWVSADEIIDTRPLFEEIRKLSEENKNLIETIAQHERRAPTITKKDVKPDNFVELENILKKIEIKIPGSLSDGKEKISNLLRIFYNNKDTLINGVTNAASVSAAESFFYHNVCPKLQVHGLVINEKVPSVRYRRSYVSPSGNAFLAQMERVIHLADYEDKDRAVGSISEA